MDSCSEENREITLVGKWDMFKAKLLNAVKISKKVGEDDPRRIVHSMKVGLALTLASFIFYFRPLYHGFEGEGMWAILTVVVVFEFTVGGTLSKSLNRGGATLVAAALGVGAEYLASLGGLQTEIYVLPVLVFITATAATFVRFLPKVRRRYDYGLLTFILTFTLVVVSGYRVGDIMQLARHRLATIAVGGAIAIVVSISVCPVWAGADLHHLVAANIQTLASILDGFGGEFFSFQEDGGEEEEKTVFLISCENVFNSKAIEESLANFAWWEPPHGRFRLHHSWQEYIKMGILTRECARQIETLGGHINSRPKVASELGKKFQEPCTTMSRELGKAMNELASTIKSMKSPSPAVETCIQNSKASVTQLKTILESSSLPKSDLPEIMQLFVVSSTLMDIIKRVDKISLAVGQLSQKAGFRNAKATSVQPCDDIPECKESVIIDIHVPPNDSV